MEGGGRGGGHWVSWLPKCELINNVSESSPSHFANMSRSMVQRGLQQEKQQARAAPRHVLGLHRSVRLQEVRSFFLLASYPVSHYHTLSLCHKGHFSIKCYRLHPVRPRRLVVALHIVNLTCAVCVKQLLPTHGAASRCFVVSRLRSGSATLTPGVNISVQSKHRYLIAVRSRSFSLILTSQSLWLRHKLSSFAWSFSELN